MTHLPDRLSNHQLRGRHGRRAIATAVLLLASAVALTWSWNEVATNLFGLPQAQFKHAVAPLTCLVLIVVLVRTIWGWGADEKGRA